jgi:hypothetical protein
MACAEKTALLVYGDSLPPLGTFLLPPLEACGAELITVRIFDQRRRSALSWRMFRAFLTIAFWRFHLSCTFKGTAKGTRF